MTSFDEFDKSKLNVEDHNGGQNCTLESPLDGLQMRYNFVFGSFQMKNAEYTAAISTVVKECL